MNINIDKLQEISDQLANRIDAINKFRQEEADFGGFMKVNNHYAAQLDLIKLSEVGCLVLGDGIKLLEGINFVWALYSIWKERIDNKIVELKNQEFSSEIIL